jgi:hypothetical protein
VVQKTRRPRKSKQDGVDDSAAKTPSNHNKGVKVVGSRFQALGEEQPEEDTMNDIINKVQEESAPIVT